MKKIFLVILLIFGLTGVVHAGKIKIIETYKNSNESFDQTRTRHENAVNEFIKDKKVLNLDFAFYNHEGKYASDNFWEYLTQVYYEDSEKK